MNPDIENEMADGEVVVKDASSPINRLSLELRQQISNSAELVDSLVTENPRQTVQNITAFEKIDKKFGQSINTETPLGKFREILNKLGPLAKKVYDVSFPENGLPEFGLLKPGSALTRLGAADGVIRFQSPDRQEKLVNDILAISKPALRMDTILYFTRCSDFKHIPPKLKDFIIKDVLEQISKHSLTGHAPTLIIASIEPQLQKNHIELLNNICNSDRFKELKMSAARRTVARERELDAARPASTTAALNSREIIKPDLDREIEKLNKKIDLISSVAGSEIHPHLLTKQIDIISGKINDHYQAARQQLKDRIRPRAALGG